MSAPTSPRLLPSVDLNQLQPLVLQPEQDVWDAKTRLAVVCSCVASLAIVTTVVALLAANGFLNPATFTPMTSAAQTCWIVAMSATGVACVSILGAVALCNSSVDDSRRSEDAKKATETDAYINSLESERDESRANYEKQSKDIKTGAYILRFVDDRGCIKFVKTLAELSVEHPDALRARKELLGTVKVKDSEIAALKREKDVLEKKLAEITLLTLSQKNASPSAVSTSSTSSSSSSSAASSTTTTTTATQTATAAVALQAAALRSRIQERTHDAFGNLLNS